MSATEKLIDDLHIKEAKITDDLQKLADDFILAEYLFHWRSNFSTGMKHLVSVAEKICKSRNPDKELVLKYHRDVRLHFHSLLQIPYIVQDRFSKSFERQSSVLGLIDLEKLWKEFDATKVNQLLLRIRHKVVHEILLDEYVTVFHPAVGAHYMEITLPPQTLESLTRLNEKGKNMMGDCSDFFIETFFGNQRGFLHLYSQYMNDLRKFEDAFTKQLKISLAPQFKTRKALLAKRSKVRRQMKALGVIFL